MLCRDIRGQNTRFIHIARDVALRTFACALCPVPWLPAMTHPGQAELKTGKETHLKDTVASFARWRRSDLVVVKLEVNVIYGIWQSTVVGLK
jgi:hypothetical protein